MLAQDLPPQRALAPSKGGKHKYVNRDWPFPTHRTAVNVPRLLKVTPHRLSVMPSNRLGVGLRYICSLVQGQYIIQEFSSSVEIYCMQFQNNVYLEALIYL